jgi:twinkle protein
LYGVVVIVICHPTKDVVGQGGKQRTPSLYDCEGSAHWFNKCDHGIIIERNAEIDGETKIHIAKSRFIETGVRGTVVMRFNSASGTYSRLDDLDGFNI